MVREKRAREIALAVLDQGRTFPNAIVLATDRKEIPITDGLVMIPDAIRFLVVDGQHRLWAQRFAEIDTNYACMIHPGLSPESMASLFLEINDTQKRVPASLRWDLVRLVRPQDDPEAIKAVEIVYLLATEIESPFYQRIDLTGEQYELQIKQASLAPEFKNLISSRSPLRNYDFQQQYDIILEYAVAISEVDADYWGKPDSAFFKARVLRALFRLLSDIITHTDCEEPDSTTFLPYLELIDADSLDPEVIRSIQGVAGIKAIYTQIHSQVFGAGHRQ